MAGFESVTFDNLSTRHREAVKWGKLIVADLADLGNIRAALRENNIVAVVHCAGSTLVGESMQNPGLYFRNNTAPTANLLEAMALENVQHLVFS
jgi:UDP-glucose 4-epimerase